jgi:hypothetical protein
MPEITAVDQTGVHHQRRRPPSRADNRAGPNVPQLSLQPLARLRCIGVFQG